MSGDDLFDLWRKQPTGEVPAMTTEALREGSARMARVSTRRNWRETLAGAIGAALVTWFGLTASPNVLARVGCALLLAGQVFVLAVLWRRGRPDPAPPPTASTLEHLAH